MSHLLSMVFGYLSHPAKPQTSLSPSELIEVGKVSTNFAAAKNGKVGSNFSAAKNGQVSSSSKKR